MLAGCSLAPGAHFQQQRAEEGRCAHRDGHRNGYVSVSVAHINRATLYHAINNGADDTEKQPRTHACGGEQERGKQHAHRRGEGDGGFAALFVSGRGGHSS